MAWNSIQFVSWLSEIWHKYSKINVESCILGVVHPDIDLTYSFNSVESWPETAFILFPDPAQIWHKCSEAGRLHVLDTETVNAGVPYGDSFYVFNRYCITRVSPAKCRLRVTSDVRYKKSVWGLTKSKGSLERCYKSYTRHRCIHWKKGQHRAML